MQYPIFDTDSNGNIVIVDWTDPVLEESVFVFDESYSSVSGGDYYYFYQNDTSFPDDVIEALLQMSQDIETMSLSPTFTNYLSSSALETFDRVIDGLEFPYYIAYSYNSDSYHAVLYYGYDFTLNGNILSLSNDVHQVTIYRDRPSSSSSYSYYYNVISVPTQTFSINNNNQYYTNMLEGYPVLGSVVSQQVSQFPFIFLGISLIIGGIIKVCSKVFSRS